MWINYYKIKRLSKAKNAGLTSRFSKCGDKRHAPATNPPEQSDSHVRRAVAYSRCPLRSGFRVGIDILRAHACAFQYAAPWAAPPAHTARLYIWLQERAHDFFPAHSFPMMPHQAESGRFSDGARTRQMDSRLRISRPLTGYAPCEERPQRAFTGSLSPLGEANAPQRDSWLPFRAQWTIPVIGQENPPPHSRCHQARPTRLAKRSCSAFPFIRSGATDQCTHKKGAGRSLPLGEAEIT